MNFFIYTACAIIAYLIGSFNPSFFIAKKKGFDIRKTGSGNAGGSNALITMGKFVGFFCMIFDIIKAYVVVTLAVNIFPDYTFIYSITSVGCILGHIFPFYMKFKGGKGLACLGGVILAFSPKIFLCLLFAELILVLIVDYICFVPMTASIIFPIIYGVLTKNIIGSLIFIPVVIIMQLKHIENIKRIMNKTEIHISFLWKKDKEIERVSKALEIETSNKKDG